MPATVELLKRDVLEQVAHTAAHRLNAARAKLALPFIEGLYEHVPPGDLVTRRPEHLYCAALSFLDFADSRRASRVALRAYTPTDEVHGWHSNDSIIEIINDDMPFLVDSAVAELNRLGIEVLLVVHPIFGVQRGADNALEAVFRQGTNGATSHESFMQIHVCKLSPEMLHRAEAGLKRVLEDVRVAVADFAGMRDRCTALSERIATADADNAADRDEVVEFLKWLNADHFTYLGYRRCEFVAEEGRLGLKPLAVEGMGILRDSQREVFEGFQPLHTRELLRIFKANQRSTVHRPVHLDALVLPELSTAQPRSPTGEGQVVHMFVGLFTLSAYSRSPEAIPLLRHKLDQTMARSGLSPQSHDGKALRYILETYPRDELFQSSVEILLSISVGILHLQNRLKVALFARRDPFHRFVSCLVYIPRDRMDTTLRMRIQTILSEAFSGSVTAFYTQLNDQPLARLHLIIKTPHGASIHVDQAAVERRLWEATRSWGDRLQGALRDELGQVGDLASRYRDAFSISYREQFEPGTAVSDIAFIERVLTTGQLAMRLYRPDGAAGARFGLRMYKPDGFIQLSDVLPMLENMGVRVISEVPYDVNPVGAKRVWLHDFSIVTDGEVEFDIDDISEDFIHVLQCALEGTLENDGFNRLVLHAGMTAVQVRLLRAYAKYLRQIRVPFSLDYMQTTLKKNARIAKLLVDLFAAKFRPPRPGEPAPRRPNGRDTIEVDVLENEIMARLDQVDSLDEDRILRRFYNAIDATVRTNFYQSDANGERKEYLSIKFECSRLEHLPQPRPYREIFVFGPRVEGVHLRFGPVARGGLRWSDRLEDFRTEVLGLVKAQQVKNAVIVPVGSKGGFVLKRPPSPEAGRDAFVAEGVACYQMFIQGLLDVTDNRVGEEIVTPPQVVCLDQTDPYLVVAADKGTATFSDIANAISQRYGFWLDDAFASGGSAGYDHKKMGITARGAWESVKRHFRELGKDIQSSPFTAIGVGDMSGDVFGNGMLLSEQTCLVAAFNHQHVFIDPSPDPARSFAERKRLFNLPRSTWADYDSSLISPGGGVFERSAKSLQLSAEARRVLGIEQQSVTPSELISHVLRAPVELLFFGGIGTYVKSKKESHADVGDRANDGLRVDAVELRAKVIGEGANLGMTQRARVEYALAGGFCNTDFIDNSAGVDCSDHEVNIKILLGEVERAGEMSRAERDSLLAEMTDEVASLVLRDNYLQTQSLSVTQHIGLRYTDRLARLVKELERAANLDRELESLPDVETLQERIHAGAGFARPELCVVFSYAKNLLFSQLMDSKLPEDGFLDEALRDYFPEPLQQRFAPYMEQHRLRNEIIATVVANEVVNRVGVTFVYEVGERVGMPPDRVVAAYIAAREIHLMSGLWSGIESLDNRVTAHTQCAMFMESGRLLMNTATWLLREYGLELDIRSAVGAYADGVAALSERFAALLDTEEAALLEQRTRQYVADGVPESLGRRVALLPLLASGCDIVTVAHEAEQRGAPRAIDEIGRLYFRVGHRFGFEWLRRVARRLPAQRAWDKQAVAAVFDELFISQRQLVSSMLAACQPGDELDTVLDSWVESKRPVVARTQQLISELQSAPTPDFAMLAVANRQLKGMLGKAG